MKGERLIVLSILLILASSIFVIAAGTSDSSDDNCPTYAPVLCLEGMKKVSGGVDENGCPRPADCVPIDNRTNYTKIYNETFRKERAEKITSLLRAINASDMRSERAKYILRELYACDQIDNRTERIQCRLEIHQVAKNHSLREDVEDEIYGNETRLPEVCKKLKDRDECRKLYRSVHYCYDLNDSREKDKCFKRVAGFVHANIRDEDNTNREGKARNYLVFLLYELQERIEEKVSSGELSAEEGASLVEQITEIKEDIMNKESREVIKPKLQEFRLDYMEAMK